MLSRRRQALEQELNSLEDEPILSRSHKKRLARKQRDLHAQLKNTDVELAAVSQALHLGNEAIYLRRMLLYYKLKTRMFELGMFRKALNKPEYKSLKERTISDVKEAERRTEALLSQVDAKDLEELESELGQLLSNYGHLDEILGVLEIRAEREFLRLQREASGDVYDYGAVVEGSFESGKRR